MAGIRDEVLYGVNVDFSGASPPSAQVTSDGELLIGSTSAPNIRVGTLTAGAGVSIVNAAGSITISSTLSISWVVETGATRNLVAFEGVFGNSGSAQTFTLPSTASVGDTFEIVQMGAGLITIDYGTGQIIHFGSSDSTTTSGNITSTAQWDTVKLVCNVADTEFTVVNGAIGNWTVT